MVHTFSVTRPASLIPPNPQLPQPPYLSPAIISLSNSLYGRESGKRVGMRDFEHPPTLPARATPSSEDARLLGPFSRRRLVNERWRFFKQEMSRLLPPLRIRTEAAVNGAEEATTLPRKHEHTLIHPADLLHAFLKDASQTQLTNLPRRTGQEVAADGSKVNLGHNSRLTSNVPRKWTLGRSPRFFRRRHQEILRLLPIMTQIPRHLTLKDPESNKSRSDSSQLQWNFSVSESPLPLRRRTESRDVPSPPMSDDDRIWVERAEKIRR